MNFECPIVWYLFSADANSRFAFSAAQSGTRRDWSLFYDSEYFKIWENREIKKQSRTPLHYFDQLTDVWPKFDPTLTVIWTKFDSILNVVMSKNVKHVPGQWPRGISPVLIPPAVVLPIFSRRLVNIYPFTLRFRGKLTQFFKFSIFNASAILKVRLFWLDASSTNQKKKICFWAIFNILLWCFISRVFQACGLYLESTF